MLRYAYAFFDNREVAEDVVQETFLVAQKRMDIVMASPNPGGWIMNTLKNIIGDVYRKRKRLLELQTTLEYKQVTSESIANPRLEYEGIIGQEDLNLLIRVYCEGVKYSEIAENLGISLSACKKRIQRAKMKFKQAMEE